MALAIFDLDNTLLGGDSDKLWGDFLSERGIVDADRYQAANQRFYEAYTRGELDIDAFLRFALRPLADNDPQALHRWREAFMREKIEPVMLAAARQLVESHRERGDTLLIITATNRFVTEPIAERFGIPNLLATVPEWRDGRFTGDWVGTPTFREGKITALERWQAERGGAAGPTTFYSDSLNDLPLLERVSEPVAVDPDPALDRAAREAGWPRLTLRDGDHPRPLG